PSPAAWWWSSTPAARSTSPRNGHGWSATAPPRRRRPPRPGRSWPTRRSSPARRRTSSSRPGSAWPPPRRTSPGSPRRWTRCPVGVSPPDRCPGTAASTTGPQRTDGGGGTVVGGRVTSVEFAQVEAELLERGFIRMVFDLGRIEELLDTLGNPQHAYPSIHITGTNGKTSTARMIDSLLRAHGLRTGRYTSPHLESVRERISIDGEPVDEERFVAAYREVGPVADLL